MVCINYMSEIPNSTVLVSLMYVKTHLTAFAITTTFYVFTPCYLWKSGKQHCAYILPC